MASDKQAEVNMGEVTAADLVPNDEQRAEALRAFFGGNPYGAPTREEQVGITSVNPDELINQPEPPPFKQVVDDAERRMAELTSPTQSTPDDVAEWKRRYGESENEKGEWRRRAKEMEDTLNLVLAQQAAQPPQPQYAQSTYAPAYQQAPQPQRDPFAGMLDNEVVQVGQIKQLLNETVAPVLIGYQQYAQEAINEVARLKQQAYASAKSQAGITPIVDMKIRAKYPYLATMPDTPDKVALIQTLLKAEQPPAQEYRPPTQQPTYQQPSQQATSVVRRVTHSEVNRGVTGEPQANVNAAFQTELQQAMGVPFQNRAVEMKKVFDKYGVPQVNTFGSGRYRV